MAEESNEAKNPSKNAVKVRYETTDVMFVSQFMINAGAEELIINLSPGYLSDPQSNENLLPIHSRIAMTYSGATRLLQTLSQVLRNVNDARQKAQTDGSGTHTSTEASLPKFS